jgi:hypothetical protein
MLVTGEMQSTELNRLHSSMSEKKGGQSEMTVSAKEDIENKITEMSESLGQMSQ